MEILIGLFGAVTIAMAVLVVIFVTANYQKYAAFAFAGTMIFAALLLIASSVMMNQIHDHFAKLPGGPTGPWWGWLIVVPALAVIIAVLTYKPKSIKD